MGFEKNRRPVRRLDLVLFDLRAVTVARGGLLIARSACAPKTSALAEAHGAGGQGRR
jgi:hypothetical protein